MGYKTIGIQITPEHFDRSIKGSPREAIKELIWNACDADAKNIESSLSDLKEQILCVEKELLEKYGEDSNASGGKAVSLNYSYPKPCGVTRFYPFSRRRP